MTYSTDLNVLQDFTDDRDQLVEVIKKRSRSAMNGMANGSTGDDSEGDTGAAYTQDDSEFNIFNTDRKLAALETRGEDAGQPAGEEGAGLLRQRHDQDRHRQPGATARHRQRRDPRQRGVLSGGRARPGGARLRWATPRRPRRAATACTRAVRSAPRRATSRASRRRSTRWPSDTGGKALLDKNDLSLGIVQAQKDIASYYILGYYSTNAALDGRYRRIKVQIGKDLTRQARLPLRLLRLQGVQASSIPPTASASCRRR